MHSHTLAYDQDDTILSGVVALWSGGSWPLAILVFFVSILVPTLKLISLSLLVVSTNYHWQWRVRERTVLYRFLEFIGRWSMLDVFVVGLLVALVKLRGIATIEAGPGALAFAAVVILTMYSAQSFDPRLMWDRVTALNKTLADT
jgi:paraquat-inducible protein A